MEFENFINLIRSKGYKLECTYGCEFYGYTCGGDPYATPCGSVIIVDELGNEVDFESIKNI